MSKMQSNNNLLYSDGWRLPPLRGFTNVKSPIFKSIKNANSSQATLFRPLAKAIILSIVDGKNVFDETLGMSEVYSSINNQLSGVAMVDNNITIAEYRQETVSHIACFDSDKKEFLFAGTTDDEGETYKPYVLDFKEGRNGTVLWLAMMNYLTNSSKEIMDCYSNLSTLIPTDYENIVKLNSTDVSKQTEKETFIICDSCYWQVGKDIEVNIPQNGIFHSVPAEVKSGAYSSSSVKGAFTVKGMCREKKKVKKVISAKDLFCKYVLDENSSKTNVPVMSDNYVVPVWVQKAAHNIQYNFKSDLSSEMKHNNIFLFGEPGSGKTEGAKAIASALGLPCTHISLSSNSTEEAFSGGISVKLDEDNSSNVLDVVTKYGGIENMVEYIDLSPDTVYEELTGAYKEDATAADCIQAYANAVANVKNDNANGGIKYTFVESDFAKAVENGWLVVIEEFTNVRDAGIAMIINQLMDGYQQITLPTGKVVKRNPKSVIVFASNVDEAQCGEFEASTLSRLKPMYKVETPNKTELIERVKNMTGYTDGYQLDTMADVIITLRSYVKEHQLVGTCGVREFAGWIIQYQADMDFDSDTTLREAALETIVPSASPHEDDINDIIRDVIDIYMPA